MTPTMSVADTLRFAKTIISDPDMWTQGSFERDGKYCVLGALSVAAIGQPIFDGRRDASTTSYIAAYTALLRAVSKTMALVAKRDGVVGVNDASTHRSVMLWIDRAVKLAEADAKAQ
jgi:hypothetical protein